MSVKSQPLRIAIYLAGGTYPEIRNRYGDFEDWFAREITRHNAATVAVDVRKGQYPTLETVDGIIITGSPASVCTDPDPWVEDLLEHLRGILARNLPTLGVCFGHQALAAAIGASVVPNPRGREMGTVELTLTEAGRQHPLFAGLSTPFLAQETHEDIVSQLPDDGAVSVLAHNRRAGFQALAYSDRIFSVQFHPEITPGIMRAYLKIYGAKLIEQGELTRDRLQSLEASVQGTDTGKLVLGNFLEIVREKRNRPLPEES